MVHSAPWIGATVCEWGVMTAENASAVATGCLSWQYQLQRNKPHWPHKL